MEKTTMAERAIRVLNRWATNNDRPGTCARLTDELYDVIWPPHDLSVRADLEQMEITARLTVDGGNTGRVVIVFGEFWPDGHESTAAEYMRTSSGSWQVTAVRRSDDADTHERDVMTAPAPRRTRRTPRGAQPWTRRRRPSPTMTA